MFTTKKWLLVNYFHIQHFPYQNMSLSAKVLHFLNLSGRVFCFVCRCGRAMTDMTNDLVLMLFLYDGGVMPFAVGISAPFGGIRWM